MQLISLHVPGVGVIIGRLQVFNFFPKFPRRLFRAGRMEIANFQLALNREFVDKPANSFYAFEAQIPKGTSLLFAHKLLEAVLICALACAHVTAVAT